MGLMTVSPRVRRSILDRTSHSADRIFRGGTATLAGMLVLLLVAIAAMLAVASAPAWERFGLGLIVDQSWDPVRNIYGALPFIAGTLLSSLIALVIAAPIGLLTAIYLAELAPRRIAAPITFLIELLAAIPSVVIGLWGIFVLSPLLRETVEAWISGAFGWIPIFAGPTFGVGLFAAGVILAIMILPTIVTISREVLVSVPSSQREAMLALGATRWEMVIKVVVPFARSGIVGAIILGLGRALGETMAVTMVIGNGQGLPATIFAQSQTIASKLATSFNEAEVGLQTETLIGIGLILLGITIALNIVARVLVLRTTRNAKRG